MRSVSVSFIVKIWTFVLLPSFCKNSFTGILALIIFPFFPHPGITLGWTFPPLDPVLVGCSSLSSLTILDKSVLGREAARKEDRRQIQGSGFTLIPSICGTIRAEREVLVLFATNVVLQVMLA